MPKLFGARIPPRGLTHPGEYTCRHCNTSVNLRHQSILANNHGLRTWLNALRVLLTSPHAPAAAALEQTAGIAPFPAQSIFERFQRVLPLWAHSPKPDITVGEVSEFLNIQLPSQHGRPGRKPVQPSQPSDNTPATGELSHMTTDNIPVPRVMPEYSAKNPATIEIADIRWPDGLHCPFCKSFDCINMELAKSPQPFQCRTCRRYFSTRTNSVLSVNSVPARFWIPLIRYVATNPVLPDPTLDATIAGTQVRQTERMMSAIADVLERWPHEPSPDVTDAQLADLLNINLSCEHPPAPPEQPLRKKKPTSRSKKSSANRRKPGADPDNHNQPVDNETPRPKSATPCSTTPKNCQTRNPPLRSRSKNPTWNRSPTRRTRSQTPMCLNQNQLPTIWTNPPTIKHRNRNWPPNSRSRTKAPKTTRHRQLPTTQSSNPLPRPLIRTNTPTFQHPNQARKPS